MATDYIDLYGVSLDEYIRIHNTTLEELIEKSTIDMEIMKNNLHRIMQDPEWFRNPMVDIVHRNIKKKSNHIEYLKDWKLAR